MALRSAFAGSLAAAALLAGAPSVAPAQCRLCPEPTTRLTEGDDDGSIRLEVNGEVRQDGDLGQMIWGIEEMIQILSEHDLLLPGDLIMTGTPAGVGPVGPGDRMTASIDGLGSIEVTLVRG